MTDGSPGVNRRTVLKLTGAATVGAATLPGVVSAKGHGRGGGGPPLMDGPYYDGVVFCGCSQVCIRDLPECLEAAVFLRDGTRVDDNLRIGHCYEGDGIAKVKDVTSNQFIYNPNMACSGNRPSDLDSEEPEDLVGTAPQLGAKCGDAFLHGGD